jgi:ABC-type bacteriocin/lantibiotic exporter with double-glycine peptidase domain
MEGVVVERDETAGARGRAPALGAAGVAGLALWLAAGCASVDLDAVRDSAATGHGHLIAGVPFVSQDDYQCGPAALAMVLGYYGVAVSPAEIAREIYLPSVRGTLNLDLEFYARRRGFATRAFEGTLDRVRDEIRGGRPLIVFQDLGVPGYPVPHFAVLVGFDDRAGVVVLHSGPAPHRVLSYQDFTRSWTHRRSFTLLITPS